MQSERGWEGRSGEETKGLAPGVTVGGCLQRFPAGRRARQTVHEGRKHNVPPKVWNLGLS